LKRLRRRERDSAPAAAGDPDAPQQTRMEMLRGGARRFFGILGIAALVVLAVSLPVGLLLGATVSRSISVGFYVIGSFLLVAGFFVGNRGPVRLKGGDTEVGSTVGMFGIGLGGRRLRWATPEENADAMASSAAFVVIGFVLILIGVIADSRVQLL
jgi:hypothetical protein